MKLLLDACVLYPTVMREMLLGAAGKALFTPLWSDRLLEEWAGAARKHGVEQELVARGEVAQAKAAFPNAVIAPTPKLEARLWLPDPADVHVLAAAIAGSADLIITLNAKDFPRNILQEEGLERRDTDALLMSLWEDHPAEIEDVAQRVLSQARDLSGQDWVLRRLLKKARLPRLGKALSNLDQGWGR